MRHKPRHYCSLRGTVALFPNLPRRRLKRDGILRAGFRFVIGLDIVQFLKCLEDLCPFVHGQQHSSALFVLVHDVLRDVC